MTDESKITSLTNYFEQFQNISQLTKSLKISLPLSLAKDRTTFPSNSNAVGPVYPHVFDIRKLDKYGLNNIDKVAKWVVSYRLISKIFVFVEIYPLKLPWGMVVSMAYCDHDDHMKELTKGFKHLTYPLGLTNEELTSSELINVCHIIKLAGRVVNDCRLVLETVMKTG